MINIQDIVIVNGLQTIDVTNLVNHTVNTWQSNRSFEEKTLNTQQGKLAEDAVKFFFDNTLKDGWFYVTYDQIRTDNYEKHAPFDGLVMSPENSRELNNVQIYELINANVNRYGQLDTEVLLDLAWAYGCEPIEIKSTKISDKIWSTTNDIQEALHLVIQQNHFLTYPLYKRYSEKDMDFAAYSNYCRSKWNLTENQVVSLNIKKHCPVNVHVYVWDSCAYIIGYIDIVSLIEHRTVQRFYKKNKSEYALYFSYPLHMGTPIQQLPVRIMRGDRL